MKALGCRGVRRRLAAFHDGELSIVDRASVQRHLSACRRCSLELHHMALIGSAVRAAADLGQHESDDLSGLRAGIVGRMEAERQTSWSCRLRDLFDDLHLVWAGLGAAAFTTACVGVLMGLFHFATAERPDSIAAMMDALASPGSNVNPVSVDGRTMQLPRADADRAVWVIGPNDDAVFALSAVVTREGLLTNLEFLQAQERTGQGLEARGRESSEMLGLLDAASRARFAPARGLGDSPIAVNVVWLLAHTTVRGKLHS
ncbi:MAG: zf-HC2 domain-containing protein [Acidobacteria bacterium]|nr:zf-HC2 domain-containing protein [Acidobacteriota bacterium]MBI3264798.1 zf-HC2 domain-containing protein [Acidobacteriota bacterium]